jgi:hypothetical protein
MCAERLKVSRPSVAAGTAPDWAVGYTGMKDAEGRPHGRGSYRDADGEATFCGKFVAGKGELCCQHTLVDVEDAPKRAGKNERRSFTHAELANGWAQYFISRLRIYEIAS